MDLFEQSLKIAKKIGNKFLEGKALNAISLIYQYIGEDYRSLDLFEESLKISREIGDKEGEGTTLNNIGTFYYNLGQYDNALDFLEQSLNIKKEFDDKARLLPTLHNMALIALRKNDINKYLKYHSEAWRLAHELNNTVSIFEIGRSYGCNLYNMNRIDEGKKILLNAYRIGKRYELNGILELEIMLRQNGFI